MSVTSAEFYQSEVPGEWSFSQSPTNCRRIRTGRLRCAQTKPRHSQHSSGIGKCENPPRRSPDRRETNQRSDAETNTTEAQATQETAWRRPEVSRLDSHPAV